MSYTVDEKTYQVIFQNIFDSIVKDKAKKKNHAVLFLGGQPGAGKSTFYSMDYNFTDYIVVDGDRYRKCHPYYEDIVKYENKKMPEITQTFVNQIVEDLIGRLSKEGYNLIIEGTLRDPAVPIKTSVQLKKQGYRAELYVIACDACESWEATVSRAKLMQEIGEKPRIVPIEKYNSIVNNLSESLHSIEKSGCMSRITIIDRGSNILWKKDISNGTETDAQAANVLEGILNLSNWNNNFERYKKQNEEFLESLIEKGEFLQKPLWKKRGGR